MRWPLKEICAFREELNWGWREQLRQELRRLLLDMGLEQPSVEDLKAFALAPDGQEGSRLSTRPRSTRTIPTDTS